jgi:hypothetical protein
VLERVGGTFGSILVTVLISLVWLVIVVLTNIREPFLTLVFTGITYGTFAIVLSAILSTALIGELQGPLTNLLASVSVLIFNAIWGGVVGIVAVALKSITKSRMQ